MLVSVIIPVYNAQKHLEQCLDSVIAQTLRDIEIICIDDGSTDNSPAILDEYAANDPRFVVRHIANVGAGAARNIGLEIATGKYLSFLDADDFFEPAMLECAYQAAENVNAQIVVFRADLYNNKYKHFFSCDYALRMDLLPAKLPFAAQDVKRNLFKTVVGWTWDKIFLTEYIKQNAIRFQEQRTTNDAFFVFAALAKADRITVINKVFAHQRRNAGITLSVSREHSWMCFYEMLRELRLQLISWGVFERFERDFVNYALHFSLWNLHTLKDEIKVLLYNKLRSEWFYEFGIRDKPRSYFYRKSEYAQMQRIIKHPFSKRQLIESKWQRIKTQAEHFIFHI